jgi:hypothetical protein
MSKYYVYLVSELSIGHQCTSLCGWVADPWESHSRSTQWDPIPVGFHHDVLFAPTRSHAIRSVSTLHHRVFQNLSDSMHAALSINEILAFIVAELRDSQPSLAALSSTNQLFFTHARLVLWEKLPSYEALAYLMPPWSWEIAHGPDGSIFIVRGLLFQP